MFGRSEAERHASAWADAWNRGDLDALLEGAAADVAFVSPLAADLTGSPTIQGKRALRRHWAAAIAEHGLPHFSIEQALWDGGWRSLLILYTADLNGRRRRACELLQFDPEGRLTRGEAFRGATEAAR